MLRLWRERVHIGFAPDHVAWIRYNRRGNAKVKEKAVTFCQPATVGSAWQPALTALSESIGKATDRRASATVVISDALVRYTLVPSNSKVSTPDEEIAYARHCFEALHGNAVDEWELRLSPAGGAELRIASAVDRALIEGLRGTLGNAHIRVESIQPLLMAAFNRGRRHLDGAPSLFITAEGQHYTCVSYLDGACRSVRSGRFSRGGDELGAVLEREWLWLGSNTRPDVTLFLSGEHELGEFDDERWSVSALKLPAPPAFSAGEERSYALALSVS